MVKKLVRKNYKKKLYRKKKMRIQRPLNSRVHFFKRHCDLGVVTWTSGSTAYLNSFEFKLSDLPNYSEFTALYDSYQIKGVKFVFVPTFSNATFEVGSPTLSTTIYWGAARCYSAIDLNDASNPGTINEIREYSNCRMSKFIRGHKRYLKPRLIDAGDAYNLQKNIWLKTAAPTEIHYSLKFGIDFSVSSGSSYPVGRVEAVYYLAMKSAR